jgi:hypothetical protein
MSDRAELKQKAYRMYEHLMMSYSSDISSAINRGDNTITVMGKAIDLPSPQTAGTTQQCRTYTRLKVEQIIKEINQ